ncbi:MAG: CHRD domain-containing protein [Gemmatimonadales bacterium]
MRSLTAFGVVCAIGGLLACDDEVGPTEVETFTAVMNGANVNPPSGPITTPATGTATLSVVGGVIVYRIDVADITDVFAAHIHAPAIATVNAGVTVNLCGTGGPTPDCESGTGVLAAGVATQVNGMSFDRLLTLFRTDSAYVNVHTTANPGGEIRGQIRAQ